MPSKNIPARTKKLIIQETGGVCAFCSETEVADLEFHHTLGREGDDPHRAENIIYICKNCHGKITAGVISESDVVLKKRIISYEHMVNTGNSRSGKVISVTGGINTGTIANEVHFHSKNPRQTKVAPPPGAIASDAIKRNYLKHLIDRYHNYAQQEKGKDFKYQVFYQSIIRKFGAKWDMIPIDQFNEVCLFVQNRIDKTVTGRKNKAKNQKTYSLFHEYLDKYTNSGRR